MREMKDSGIEWIGEIPKEWNARRAKTLFRQRMSKGNTNTVLLAATQKYGMFPQHLLEGVVQVKEDTDFQTFKTVHTNDYVISLRSFQGGFEISEYEGVCSPAYQVFYNVKDINFGFYRYLFKSDCFISKMNSLTVGIREGKNIQFSDFAKTKIPIPPLSTQHRIADYLDDKCGKIDRYIEQQKQVIEKLKAYKQSVITEAVTKGLDPTVPMKDSGVEWIGEIPEGWEIKRIKHSFTVFSGTTPKSEKTENWGGIIPWITPADYKTEDKYVSSGRKSITEIGMQSCGLNWAIKGSLIFSKRAPIGLVAIASNDLTTNQGCLSCVPYENVCSTYFYYAMSAFTEQFDLLGSGTTFKEISANAFGNFKLPCPCLDEQIRISNFLDNEVNSIINAITKKQTLIEKLTEYKKSLIYEVVTGKKEV